MTKRFFFSFYINCLCILSFAEKYQVSGYLYDENSHEPIVGATCYDSINKIGTTSNEEGYFYLLLPKGNVSIVVTYLNYYKNRFEFFCSHDTVLTVSIKPVNIDEVTIVANEEPLYKQALSGKTYISVKKIDNLPSYAGQTDLFKSITFLPGVNTGKEGKSDLYVRGGSKDQNLLIMDEAVIYSPYHAAGFLTGINTDAINSVDFYKGGFPARYGDRLSSIIDVQLKEGNKKEWHGKLMLGLIASNLYIEGPIVKERTSVMLAARSSYFDLITMPMMRDFKSKDRLPLSYQKSEYANAFSYNFYDVNFKFSHIFNRNNKIDFNIYQGNDNLFDGMIIFNKDIEARKKKNGFTINNKAASITLTNYITSGILLKTAFSYSHYRGSFYDRYYFLNPIEHNQKEQSSLNTLNDITFRSQLMLNIGNRHNVRTGIQFSRYKYQPGETHIFHQDFVNDTKFDTVYLYKGENFFQQISCFLEDEFRKTDNIILNTGIRISLIDVHKRNYFTVEPRISLRYLLRNNISLKASYGIACQYLQALSSHYGMLEKEIWVGTTSNIPPAYSHQISTGIWGMTNFHDIEYGIEGYYKKMYNLIDYQSTSTRSDKLSATVLDNWEHLVTKNGTGEAYGIEIFLQKKGNRHYTAFAYTLSWNNRQFDELNGGKTFPFIFDTRHQANVIMQYDISEMYSGSINFTISSGSRVNLPEAYVQPGIFSKYYMVYGPLNSYALPIYHRLDVMTQKRWKSKRGLKYHFRVNVYNIYARQNPSYLYISNNKVYKRSFFTIIPTIAYGLEF